jgi:hypothetical protein
MSGRAALAFIPTALLAACGTFTPTSSGGSPAVSAAVASPAVDACARASSSGDWTTDRSFAGGIVPRGDTIQLALGGRPDTAVRVTVTAPDGSDLNTTKVQEQRRGSAAQYVARYPADFTPPGLTGVLDISTPGAYRVTWEAGGTVAACDRFEVLSVGVADAQGCAPSGWSATAQGSTLVMRSGTATMSLKGASVPIGIAVDPWYAFEPADRQPLTLSDGSTATLIVSRTSSPRRVASLLRAGPVGYTFDASGDRADLADTASGVIVCAHQRLRTASSGASPSTATAPAATIDPRPVVMPPTATLRVGETQRFIAAQQERGSFGPPIRVAWSVSPPSLGSITADGVFTASSVGTGSVTATLPGTPFTGTASVTVR